jgi:hypothetical protein
MWLLSYDSCSYKYTSNEELGSSLDLKFKKNSDFDSSFENQTQFQFGSFQAETRINSSHQHRVKISCDNIKKNLATNC